MDGARAGLPRQGPAATGSIHSPLPCGRHLLSPLRCLGLSRRVPRRPRHHPLPFFPSARVAPAIQSAVSPLSPLADDSLQSPAKSSHFAVPAPPSPCLRCTAARRCVCSAVRQGESSRSVRDGPAAGPYWAVPMVTAFTLPNAVTALTSEQVEYLHKRGRAASGSVVAGSVLATAPGGRQLRAKAAPRRMLSATPSALAESITGVEVEDDEVDPPTTASQAAVEGAVNPSLHLNLQAHRSVAQQSHSTISQPLTTSSSYSALHTANGAGGEFESCIRSGLTALQRLIGGAELTREVVYWELLPVREDDDRLILPVVVTRMGAVAAEEESNPHHRWVWLQTFEALQTRAGVKSRWIKRVLTETGAKDEWENEGSKALTRHSIDGGGSGRHRNSTGSGATGQQTFRTVSKGPSTNR